MFLHDQEQQGTRHRRHAARGHGAAPYELAQGQRLTVGPYTADYREGSDLFKMLWRIVEGIADSIVVEQAQRIRPAPAH